MKLLSDIRNWLKNRNTSTLPVVRRSAPLTLAQAWLQAQEDEYGAGPKLLNAMQQSVWVYACVKAISEQVADIPFVFSVGERGGEHRVHDGPAVDLFNQPDPLMDRFIFWELVCQWLLLRGKCYLVALDRNGLVLSLRRAEDSAPYPARLVLLNPDRVRPLRAGREFLGYQYQAGAGDPIGNQSFLPEEVINLRMPYAYDYLEGLPPLGVALLAAETDFASAQLMKGLVLNNADSGLIVTTPTLMTDEQKTQVVAALRERKRAAGTADRPLFLSDNCRVQKPPLLLGDMQFLENRKFNRQEICAIFRVPQEVLGYTEDANRAVAESVRLSFIENRIVPFCRRLEAAVEPIVKLFGPELWGFFDWEALPVMQGARRLRYQTAREGFEMGVPLNVLNQVFDLGLPRLGHGDVSFLPGNFQQIGATTKDTKDTKLQIADCRLRIGPMERVDGLLGLLEEKNGKWEMGDGVLAHGHLLAQGHLVKSLEGKFSKFFFEQRGRTLERIKKAEGRIKNGEAMANGSEPEWPRWQMANGEMFDVRGEDQFLVERMGPVLRGVLTECVREQQKESPGFELSEGDRAAFLEEREVALREVNEATAVALREAVDVKGVKGVFQVAGEVRARELAEREVGMAWGFVRNVVVLEKDQGSRTKDQLNPNGQERD